MFSIYFQLTSHSSLNPHMPPDSLLAPIAAHMHEYFIKTGKIVFSYYKLLAHASHYFYAMYIFCALCWGDGNIHNGKLATKTIE